MRGAIMLVFVLTLVIPASQSATLAGAPPQGAPASSPGGALPADVDPVSRNRLPVKKPDVTGAAAIRLHASGANVRWASPLGRALTELAILVTAREHDQPYEWSLHEMEAVAVGLEPATIDVVRNRRPLAQVPERQAAVIQMGREIFGTHALSSGTYARALKLFGPGSLVDIVDLMGTYGPPARGSPRSTSRCHPAGSSSCRSPSRRPTTSIPTRAVACRSFARRRSIRKPTSTRGSWHPRAQGRTTSPVMPADARRSKPVRASG